MVTSTNPIQVDAAMFGETVVRILRPRHGRRPWPKKQLDRWVLLHCAARRITAGELLTEREVNVRLQDWLLGPADRLAIDFVTVRRALIDEGFWDRDPGGTRYRLAARHEHRVRFAAALPDETGLLAAADDAMAERPGRPRPEAEGDPSRA